MASRATQQETATRQRKNRQTMTHGNAAVQHNPDGDAVRVHESKAGRVTSRTTRPTVKALTGQNFGKGRS